MTLRLLQELVPGEMRQLPMLLRLLWGPVRPLPAPAPGSLACRP